VEGSCEHGNEPSGSINVGKFLSSCTDGGFSRRAQLHEVSVFMCNQIMNCDVIWHSVAVDIRIYLTVLFTVDHTTVSRFQIKSFLTYVTALHVSACPAIIRGVEIRREPLGSALLRSVLFKWSQYSTSLYATRIVLFVVRLLSFDYDIGDACSTHEREDKCKQRFCRKPFRKVTHWET
jgi:hypothetical protein